MHNKHAQKQGKGLLARALAAVMAAVIALSLVPTRAMAEQTGTFSVYLSAEGLTDELLIANNASAESVITNQQVLDVIQSFVTKDLYLGSSQDLSIDLSFLGSSTGPISIANAQQLVVTGAGTGTLQVNCDFTIDLGTVLGEAAY